MRERICSSARSMTTQKCIHSPAGHDAVPITVHRRLDCALKPHKQKAVDSTAALGLTSTDAAVIIDEMTHMWFS